MVSRSVLSGAEPRGRERGVDEWAAEVVVESCGAFSRCEASEIDWLPERHDSGAVKLNERAIDVGVDNSW